MLKLVAKMSKQHFAALLIMLIEFST